MSPTIVITGVSSGFGLASAWKFANEGWNVVGTTRNGEVPDSLPASAMVYPLDVTDLSSAAELGERARAAFGTVDVLVNNAGYYQMGPLETSSMAQIKAQFETNVFGLIAVTQGVLPIMRVQKSGLIVNVSSISAENGYPYTSVYGASKAAVLTITESLNVELSPLGISAKAILPGAHATRIFTKIDLAEDFPEEYRPLLRRFLEAQTASKGSPPTSVSDVLWTAVNDGRADKVRYYAGPDAEMIPSSKRLMGQDRYFATVKKAILHGPGRFARLLARQGNETLTVDLSKAEKVLQA